MTLLIRKKQKHRRQQNIITPTANTVPPMLVPSPSQSQKNLIFGLIIYITTGIAQPILIDTLRINALLGHKYLLLPTLANTTGMALCGLLASKSQWDCLKSIIGSNSVNSSNKNLKRMILITSLIDLLSGMCLTFGILLTGGAIFVILYNSCPAWTALLSKLILGKKLGLIQFLGVLIVCVGLVVNVLGTKLQIVEDKAGNDNASNSSLYSNGVIFGSIVVLVGSLLHSLMFVLSDLSLRSLNDSNGNDKDHKSSSKITNDKAISTISGEIWACCLGTIEASFMLVWVSIGILTTGFHGNNDDNDGMSNHDGIQQGGDIMDQHQHQHQKQDIEIIPIISGFFLLVLIDTAHAAAFFILLKNIGAVASALLKGVQAVVVISLSALFFCSREQSQCLTTIKVMSACLVLGGVFCYGLGAKINNVDDDINVNKKKKDYQLSHHYCDHGNVHASTLMEKSDIAVEMKSLI